MKIRDRVENFTANALIGLIGAGWAAGIVTLGVGTAVIVTAAKNYIKDHKGKPEPEIDISEDEYKEVDDVGSSETKAR